MITYMGLTSGGTQAGAVTLPPGCLERRRQGQGLNVADPGRSAVNGRQVLPLGGQEFAPPAAVESSPPAAG